jgi:hypothetical protein
MEGQIEAAKIIHLVAEERGPFLPDDGRRIAYIRMDAPELVALVELAKCLEAGDEWWATAKAALKGWNALLTKENA